jgi:hypothetical protein
LRLRGNLLGHERSLSSSGSLRGGLLARTWVDLGAASSITKHSACVNGLKAQEEIPARTMQMTSSLTASAHAG